MTDNHRYNHIVILAVILILGLGSALALPWLLNSQGAAARVNNAPTGPGPCYVQNANSLTVYESADASAVQHAVDAANPGDVVKLAGTCIGVETRGGLTQTVYISKSLTLEGGHTASDWTTDPNPDIYTTTLDADKGGRVVVITGTVDVIIDNLFITDGLADDGTISNVGGGIYSRGALTLTNTIVFSNTGFHGGGMAKDKGSLALDEVTFLDNKAALGGGLYAFTISSTLTAVNFTKNKADGLAGGLYSDKSNLLMTHLRFIGNNAKYGGGMYNSNLSRPNMTNITFSGNSAELGGGLLNDGAWGVMTNTIFSGNKADYGGGLYSYRSQTMLVNPTVTGNWAEKDGGGMYNANSVSEVSNGIFWNNLDKTGSGTISSTIYLTDTAAITLNHSLVQASGGSGSWALGPGYSNGGGNIDSDPLFITPVDPTTAPTTDGNLRLPKNSPAVDTGFNDYIKAPFDLDNKARIVDGEMDGTPTVDMGVYEFYPYDNYLPIILRIVRSF